MRLLIQRVAEASVYIESKMKYRLMDADFVEKTTGSALLAFVWKTDNSPA